MEASVKRSIAVPRKDLSRVKRRRTRSPSPGDQTPPTSPLIYPDVNTMDLDQLLATLTGDTLQEIPIPDGDKVVVSSVVAKPEVNYYTYDITRSTEKQQDMEQDDEIYQPEYPQMKPPKVKAHSKTTESTTKTSQKHHTHKSSTARQVTQSVLPPQPPPPPPPPQQPVPATTAVTSGRPTQAISPWEPRLLLRQIYKVATQADAVVGLDSLKDFKPSCYLVNNLATINLTFEDLLSLQSASVLQAVNRYYSERVLFKPFYLHNVLVEPRPNGLVAICNYQIKQKPINHGLNSVILSKPTDESDIERHTAKILLQNVGWNSLKRLFPSLESYYNILVEISPAVQFLISRYSRYFSNHYKTVALLSTNSATSDMVAMTLDKQLVRHIKSDLPRFLRELNEKRLPIERAQDHWYVQTPLRSALLPWIDAEVKRFCVPNITDSVLENLKYVARW